MSTPISAAPTALIESLRGFSPAALLNLLQQQPSTKTIATVIALLVAYQVFFNELQLNKPKQYRNIPKVNGYHLLYYKFKKESFPRRYEYHRELMETNGIIRVSREILVCSCICLLRQIAILASYPIHRQFRSLGTDFVTIGSAELAREFLHKTGKKPSSTWHTIATYARLSFQ